jgi:hypothetical protein
LINSSAPESNCRTSGELANDNIIFGSAFSVEELFPSVAGNFFDETWLVSIKPELSFTLWP